MVGLQVFLPLKTLADAQTAPPADDSSEIAPSESVVPKSLDTLSFEAQDTAKKLGIWDALVQYDALRKQKSRGAQVGTDYMESRQNLLESVMLVSQEARTFVHFVEQEIAKADSINATLAARRDRALKLNTYADLISGGITGMIGGGLKLGDVNHIGPDTIDSVEGLVQTTLAIMSLRNQRGDKRIEKGIPNLLSALFEPDKGPSAAYPASVWAFLNSSANPGGASRRQKLVDDWTSSGFCITHRGGERNRRGDVRERRERLLNKSRQNYPTTSDLIEDRTAMLHELRSTVTRLDVIMLEIMIYMRGNRVATSTSGS